MPKELPNWAKPRVARRNRLLFFAMGSVGKGNTKFRVFFLNTIFI